ncbi:hypothetical protein [Clostridium perfringens]|uniref:hypothetical protein n=1 Tax=Clostridium perfringens TaxID=1502 RepID=UPI0030CC67EC
MAKKIWNWILFIVAIVYLIVAFTEVCDGFNKNTMFSTDGLALVMIVITFIETFISNSKLYIPMLNNLILKIKNYDYKLTIQFKTNKSVVDLNLYKDIIESSIFNNMNMSKKVINPTYIRKTSIKYYYKNVHSNLELRFNDYDNDLIIELDGGIKYSELNKLIKSIENVFVDNLLKDVKLKRIELCINLERSRLKVSDRFNIDSNYNVNSMLIDINIDKNTSLKITEEDISIDSITSSGFFSAYKELTKLLSEYILQGDK